VGLLIFRNLKIFLASSIFLISCSHDLIIKNFYSNDSGILMFGKVPQRNFYEDVSISDSLELLWKAETNGSQANTSIIINNDFLFVSDLSGRIYGFNIKSGKSTGYYKFSGSIVAAPIINKLRIYFAVNLRSENYSLFVMKDINNAKTLSETKIKGSINSEMLKLNDGIFVLSDRGELIKFNYAGIKVWSVETKTSTHSITASDGNIVIFGNDNGELFFVSSNQGKILFRKKISEYSINGITIDNNNAYFCDSSGKLFSFNIQTKKINWIFNSKANIVSIPVFNSENIFIGNLLGKIFSIDKNNGKLKWSIDTRGIINSTPLLLKNFLIQPDLNKKIYFINPENGVIKKTLKFDTRLKLSPVYFDEYIFFGADRGQIFAYKTFRDN